jgi:hypothetical protein
MTEQQRLEYEEYAKAKYEPQPGKHWVRQLRNAKVDAFVWGCLHAHEVMEKEIQAKDREIEKLNEIKKIVEYLMNHPHFNFEDQVYSVRDREGEGWDGPHVIGYGSAVAHLKELIPPNDGKIEA